MTATAVPTFAERMNGIRERVAGLRVLRYEEDASSPMPIDPERLEHDEDTEAFDTTNEAAIADALDAIESSAPSAGDVTADCRWAAIFVDVAGERLLAAYTDRFGTKGAIDGESVTFASEDFADWLHANF